MDDDVKTLGDYISIAWRRKYYLLIPFIVVMIATIVTLFVLPPVYKSTGTILIESQQIPQEMIQSTVTSFADERIQIIQQRIMTSQQLFNIIKKFKLYEGEIETTARSDILQDMRSRVTVDLVSANVKNGRKSARALIAFTISFEHRVAQISQRVANELVTLFLDENIKSRTARAEETSEFLKKESDRLGAEIEAMGAQIAQYKQQYAGSLPESLKLNLERVVEVRTTLLKVDADINALNERKKLLLIDLDTLKLHPEVGLNAEQQQQKQELTNLQNQYISLAARYGPEHPDVKAIKRQIAAFEDEYGNLSDINELKSQQQEVRKEIVELTKKYSSEHPDVKRLERKQDGIIVMIAEYDEAQSETGRSEANPQALQLKAKIESVDSSINRLKKSGVLLEEQISELEVRISRAPQVERGLEALERDYDDTKRKYKDMKAKQSQAELSKNLEEEQKGERFTLLEPPLLPDQPIKPNRPKVFMLGLILSFISGVGVTGLAESRDGGIRGSRALARVTRMTPLVTIPYITTHKDLVANRRKVKIFIFVIVILVVIFLALVHFFYKPLDLLWFIALRYINLV